MQELDNLGLVGWFHSGEAAGLSDSVLLIVWREVIEFTAREGLSSDILVLTKDTNATTDGHRSAFVVTCGWRKECLKPLCLIFHFFKMKIWCTLTGDHDNADPSSSAQLDGAHHFFTRGVEHANTAHEGQVGLNSK